MKARVRSTAVLALALAACRAGSPPPAAYAPDRFDYYAFRAAYPQLVEPNYLPFMAHPVEIAGGTALVFCRPAAERFPWAVHVEPPRIPDELQDEFAPIPAEAYVAAVHAALAAWEHELEGLVRFRRAAGPDDAALRIHLLAEVAPAPEPTLAVLGEVRLGGVCRVLRELDENRVEVEYQAPDVRVYLADDYGLLNPDQIERVAVHEIGHALGMRGHSPVPIDVMYPVARDAPRSAGPSEQDVNSFVSLYSLPQGALFARIPREDAEAGPPREPGPPAGPPILAPAPHVDARFGYQLRLPEGWQVQQSERGVIAADGLAWDYDATFQVIVRGYARIDEYLARYGGFHVGAGRVAEQERVHVDGRPALRLVVVGRAGPLAEEITFVEVGDGRLLVVIADCPTRAFDAYRPWFAASLATLRIRSLAPTAADPP